jgi:release factor glutamine methyltransferase
LEPEVRDLDPRLALDGGEDGLAAYRESSGCGLLAPGGLIALEVVWQYPAVEPLLCGSFEVKSKSDLT